MSADADATGPLSGRFLRPRRGREHSTPLALTAHPLSARGPDAGTSTSRFTPPGPRVTRCGPAQRTRSAGCHQLSIGRDAWGRPQVFAGLTARRRRPPRGRAPFKGLPRHAHTRARTRTPPVFALPTAERGACTRRGPGSCPAALRLSESGLRPPPRRPLWPRAGAGGGSAAPGATEFPPRSLIGREPQRCSRPPAARLAIGWARCPSGRAVPGAVARALCGRCASCAVPSAAPGGRCSGPAAPW